MTKIPVKTFTNSKGMFWFIKGNIKVLMICRLIWSWSTSIGYPYFSLYVLALGGSPREVGLISSLGLISGMFLYPVGGYLADKYGRVKLIGYSTVFYTAAYSFFVIAKDWQTLALGQFFTQLLLFYMPAMNALSSDSLPPGVRGKGFAIMMAVPGAIRIIAPYMGGALIELFGGGDDGLIKAVRLAWATAVIIGFLVAYLRLRYLEETKEGETIGYSWKDGFKVLREAYSSILESVKWMDKSIKIIVSIEMLAAFFVASSSPFWVVYAKQIVGITPYQWGLVMLVAGGVGLLIALPMGMMVDRFGPRKLILTGLFLASIVIFSYQFVTGFFGVLVILCGLSIVNNIMIPAFSTLIADMIPRDRRGRLYSLLGERGITISWGNFWGGGFLLFIPAAIGAYIGGVIYEIGPKLPWIITSMAMILSLILVYYFIKEPVEAQR
jgi:MFS family permease